MTNLNPNSTAIAVTTQNGEAHVALVAKITASTLVPVKDAAILAEVVEGHNAQLHRVLALIEEYDLSAQAVARLYETRAALGEGSPTLAALARTTTLFSEFASGDPDDIAELISETCHQVSSHWPHRNLFSDTILKQIAGVAASEMMSFSQAAERLMHGPESGLDEDGEFVFYDS